VASEKTFEIRESVRGELRVGGEVLSFDIEAGQVGASGVHPAVLEHLINDGHAVPTRKEPKK